MLDRIKNTCQYVTDNSRYVTINYNKLDEFINNIDASHLKNWILYNPYNILELDIETLINFLLIFEAIDYSFWGQPKWEVYTDDGIKDGSDALLYIMLKYVKETKNTDFSNITIEEFRQLLKGNTEIPLLKERYETISDISKIVNEQMNGSFYNYIKDINL